MDYLKNLFNGKDKKMLVNVALGLIAGLTLLFLGNSIFDSTHATPVVQ